ncbi:MAG: hypothetical protein E7546_07295 [Ruminococcaceae bacterium]|nr:hypothetical protein [Oscillospiraceae bacterium]
MSTRFFRPEDRLPEDDDNAFSEEELYTVIDLVRDSSFIDDESGLSIEERLTDLFCGEEPDWVAFQSPDAVCYVNAYGTIRSDDGEVRLALQFELSDSMEEFMLTAMLINDLEQDENFISDFESRFSLDNP